MDNNNDTAACPDGSPAAPGGIFSTHFTWDPNTLAGTAQHTLNVPACGAAAGTMTGEQNLQLSQAP